MATTMTVVEAPVAKRRKIDQSNGGLAGFAKWDLEADYQRRNRKSKDDGRHQKLPYKTAAGRVVEQEVIADTKDIADSEKYANAGADGEGSDVKGEQADAAPRPRGSHKQEVIEAKESLARIAAIISENPEDNISHLSRLKDIANSENETVQRLALVTQSAVYKDIIPGYRIRPLAKDDLLSKVGKDLKKLRAFEQSLLSGYTDYVRLLDKLARSCISSGTDAAGLGRVALICVCTLLEEVPHFNCRNDLLATIIFLLARASSLQSVDLDRAVATVEKIFQNDEDGHTSLETVTQMTKMLKDAKYRIDERLLNTFLHLRLLNEFRGKASTERTEQADDEDKSKQSLKNQKREYRSKRERKVAREQKAIAKEMTEADAAVSHEERDQNQAQTLKLVFIAYFRILKARVPSLTGAVLEGLARYAHLINQDFFGDLLEVLRELIQESKIDATDLGEDNEEGGGTVNRNTTRHILLCITTAFAMLQGQVEVSKSAVALHLDLNHFVSELYRLLHESGLDADIELSSKTKHLSDPNGLRLPSQGTKVNVATTTVLLLRSLSAALLPPTNTRSVPPARINAFVKRLLSIIPHLPPKSAVAMTGLLNQIAKTHGPKMAFLWNTDERRGDGVFNALSEDIETSNPFATTVWEGEILRHHFDPKVREGILNVERTIKQAIK